jgi:hypothetical protein
MEDMELESQTFHLTKEEQQAALAHAYLELQLSPVAALQAAQADLLLLDGSCPAVDAV